MDGNCCDVLKRIWRGIKTSGRLKTVKTELALKNDLREYCRSLPLGI